MPGHAHTAHAPHHRPAEHAGAHSTQRKPRRTKAAPLVPLPRPRPKALEKAAEPEKDVTEKSAATEEEEARPTESTSPAPAEKPAEEKPAAPLPEPKAQSQEREETQEGVESEKAAEPERPEAEDKADKGAKPPKPEATEEKKEGTPGTGENAEDEFREIPEMAPTPDPDCTALKASGVAEFEELPPLSEGVCGTPNPIRTTAIRLSDGTKVTLEPASVTRCAVIAALAAWMREDVEPTARDQLGGPVTALRLAGSYVCRGRDGNSAAQISEHAHANAVDISAFKTKSGQWKNVKDMGAGGNGFLAIVRGKACGRFTTVIGPGLDQYHSDHLHFDTKLRGRNGRSLFCQ